MVTEIFNKKYRGLIQALQINILKVIKSKGWQKAEEGFIKSNIVKIGELLYQDDYGYFIQKCLLYGMPKNEEIFDLLACLN